MVKGKRLVIVESPTKAKTISGFLGSDYIVESSFGHVRDLPKSKIGIDIKNDFTPQYVVPRKNAAHVAELKKLASKASEIILASDEDREGEAIAWHISELFKEAGSAKDPKSLKRIVFHEITKEAIKEAVENPRKIDMNLVDAQQARRILDRLVGYELSPFLWKKIRYGLSAGRVQSVAVRLIVEREREIEKFKAEEYWSIQALLSKDKKDFTARLYSANGKTVGKMDIETKDKAEKIASEIKKETFTVSEISTKRVNRNPAAPFTTSTLQQEAARKLGFSAKQTMVIAQQLYENGFITYMRTDSVALSTSSLARAKQIIEDNYGKKYSLESPRYFSNKSKGAQEAHEAIRPTDIGNKLGENFNLKDRGQHRLYDLIWKRTVASQMAQAEFEQTSIDLKDDKNNFVLRATGQVMLFDGFIRVYTEGKDEQSVDDEENSSTLPNIEKGDSFKPKDILTEQHFTEPPARYTDATLIKALEAHGVGRPSTYAPTLSTIQERDYVEKEDKKYKPTETGVVVNDMLVENFPEIVDINFTSHIEEEFDEIAEGKLQWNKVIKEFYTPFKIHLDERMESVEKKIEISETPCPHCGKPMVIKFGRTGKFLACPDPEVKVTLPLPEEAAKIKELSEKTKGELCPICGKQMEVKRGRFGYFLGCVDYPKCKGISKIWNKTGFKCPNCFARLAEQDGERIAVSESEPSRTINITSPSTSSGQPNKLVGDIVEKRGRGRGKPFYACTRYPDCEFVMNKKPETQTELDEAYKNWKANPPKPRTSKYSKSKKSQWAPDK